MKILEFFALLLLALVTGVLWGTWVSLSRSIETFSAETFLQIGQRMIKNLALPMRFLMPATLLATIGLDGLLLHRSAAGASWGIVSSLCMAGVIVVTLVVNVPIDLKIRAWNAHNLPADWQQLRRRWQTFHTVRTVLAVASLAFLIVAVLR